MSDDKKRKPSPLRGLVVGVVIMLIIPSTRDTVIEMGAYALGIAIGLIIVAFLFIKPR